MGYTFRFCSAGGVDAVESEFVEERLRFVARLLDGEAMTEVCREYGISRKTGHKIFDRGSIEADMRQIQSDLNAPLSKGFSLYDIAVCEL
jgi:Homeodomain-like domain